VFTLNSGKELYKYLSNGQAENNGIFKEHSCDGTLEESLERSLRGYQMLVAIVEIDAPYILDKLRQKFREEEKGAAK
jgi:hypothetical protein